jgi:hypothetical protein
MTKGPLFQIHPLGWAFIGIAAASTLLGSVYTALKTDKAITAYEQKVTNMEPVPAAVLSTLEQKCGGDSYTFVHRDYPGEIMLQYDAIQGSYALQMGHFEDGVRGSWFDKKDGSLGYSNNHRVVYSDTDGDGFVDLRVAYSLHLLKQLDWK